jgi:hypothetical protein
MASWQQPQPQQPQPQQNVHVTCDCDVVNAVAFAAQMPEDVAAIDGGVAAAAGDAWDAWDWGSMYLPATTLLGWLVKSCGSIGAPSPL